MMVSAVLTLTPRYTLIQDLHLTNTWWALILPWVAGGQVFGILLCRTFIENQPASLFESARIDGCSELKSYFYIALPLAKPILATLSIMTMIGEYNDFIWPLMVIESNNKQVVTVAIRVYQANVNGSTNVGVMVAGFAIATIPLFLLFLTNSRLYIEGITSGAVKE
jgi:multiple sugar transport system permease protein